VGPNLVGVALLLASKHHLLTQLAFGSMFSPEVLSPIIVVAGWAFGSFLFLAVLLLDLAWVILATARLRAAAAIVGGSRIRCVCAAVVAVLSAVGIAQAIQVPGVRRVELRIAGPPAEMQGFRVIQLTGLHIGRLFHADWASQVVGRANALNPDLMLIAIPGNHEYSFNGTAWMRELQGFGMRILVNQHAVVRVGDVKLVVAGVADEAALRFGMDGPDLQAALRGGRRTPPRSC
jgi:hypothetical protein